MQLHLRKSLAGTVGLTVNCLLIAALAFGMTAISRADTTIYGMNYGGAGVQIYDANTGASMGVIDTTEMQSGNGRGVVVVGDLMYYTLASSNNVYAYNLHTATDLGVQFSVSGASGLATMAFDGTSLFLGDYSGTNHVYKYSLNGTLLQTISLADCSGFCDGLEYANGDLVSNEFDGGFGGPNTYDKYDLNGNLLQHPFITTANFGGETGIAFDGHDYWVSEIFAHKLAEYDINGNFVGETVLQNFAGSGFEDLSANYAAVLTPEPSYLAFFVGALVCVGVPMARKRIASRS